MRCDTYLSSSVFVMRVLCPTFVRRSIAETRASRSASSASLRSLIAHLGLSLIPPTRSGLRRLRACDKNVVGVRTEGFAHCQVKRAGVEEGK